MPRADANLTCPAPLMLSVPATRNLFNDAMTKLTTSVSRPVLTGRTQTAKVKASIEQARASFGKPVEMSTRMFVSTQCIRTTRILMLPNPFYLRVLKQVQTKHILCGILYEVLIQGIASLAAARLSDLWKPRQRTRAIRHVLELLSWKPDSTPRQQSTVRVVYALWSAPHGTSSSSI